MVFWCDVWWRAVDGAEDCVQPDADPDSDAVSFADAVLHPEPSADELPDPVTVAARDSQHDTVPERDAVAHPNPIHDADRHCNGDSNAEREPDAVSDNESGAESIPDLHAIDDAVVDA